MKLAFCYESVLPARGGCETYIADLARRLVADGHEVHLHACRWDAAALPEGIYYHRIPMPRGPRFLRPWRFASACEQALRGSDLISIGFDKTWGQDILYPQGGLHAASVEHNLHKYANPLLRRLVRWSKAFDLAHWSFACLERRQYLGADRPLIVVNSNMVRRHFRHYHGIDPSEVRVVRAASDPGRFTEHDRPRRRAEWRRYWGISPRLTVALFAAMNYRLKGLVPLLHAVRHLRGEASFRLLIVGNPRIAAFQRLAQRLDVADQVIFAGHCADMRNAYFAADFLVHPTFYDPCSLVVLEAMACGLPVVTTRANGASELMTPPDEGYVIDNLHDHERLAWCMRQLLDSSRRAACTQAVRRTAAQWTFEHHYQQMLEVFAEAAARKQAA